MVWVHALLGVIFSRLLNNRIDKLTFPVRILSSLIAKANSQFFLKFCILHCNRRMVTQVITEDQMTAPILRSDLEEVNMYNRALLKPKPEIEAPRNTILAKILIAQLFQWSDCLPSVLV